MSVDRPKTQFKETNEDADTSYIDVSGNFEQIQNKIKESGGNKRVYYIDVSNLSEKEIYEFLGKSESYKLNKWLDRIIILNCVVVVVVFLAQLIHFIGLI